MKSAQETVVIIGQGYVGLPLAKEAALSGLRVWGLDTSAPIVSQLNLGQSHVDDISHDDLSVMRAQGYAATVDEDVLAHADTIVICVPTPLGDGGSPDLGAVEAAVNMVAGKMSKGSLVVLESTTYPGTTDDLVLPLLEASGLHLDSDFFLAFSPERIDPGNAEFGLKNTPKVVGGVSSASTKAACEFYAQFVDEVVPVKSAREAETAKLLENTYRHVNIALVNEMAKFCHDLEIDLWDVIRAASTKPFGFAAFYPGPGVGGHCIPIDPNYLSYQVRRQLSYPFRFVELAEEINNSMPTYVVRRVQEMLNRESRSLNGANVLLLGVTYKANIADQRESPAVEITERLEHAGAVVDFHDPHVKIWNPDGRAPKERVQDMDLAVRTADVVLLLQSHKEYDADQVASQSKMLLDTRGKLAGEQGEKL